MTNQCLVDETVCAVSVRRMYCLNGYVIVFWCSLSIVCESHRQVLCIFLWDILHCGLLYVVRYHTLWVVKCCWFSVHFYLANCWSCSSQLWGALGDYQRGPPLKKYPQCVIKAIDCQPRWSWNWLSWRAKRETTYCIFLSGVYSEVQQYLHCITTWNTLQNYNSHVLIHEVMLLKIAQLAAANV